VFVEAVRELVKAVPMFELLKGRGSVTRVLSS
jgi:hypothetical protein